MSLVNLLLENADGSLFTHLFCHLLQYVLLLSLELLYLFFQYHGLEFGLVQLFIYGCSISQNFIKTDLSLQFLSLTLQQFLFELSYFLV